jgi:F-type H+-transporting ATPase subunit delta
MAVLDLAVEHGAVDVVRDQLDALSDALGKSEAVRVAFTNPTITTSERKAVVTQLSSALGLHALTRKFLSVLAEKGRLGAIADIATTYGRLADARTGAARAEVVSSTSLTAAQEAQLATTLGTVTGKKVTVTTTVDPALVGGLRVTIDGRVYDTSVATRITRLREAILSDL